jgi:hypothetical protein
MVGELRRPSHPRAARPCPLVTPYSAVALPAGPWQGWTRRSKA